MFFRVKLANVLHYPIIHCFYTQAHTHTKSCSFMFHRLKHLANLLLYVDKVKHDLVLPHFLFMLEVGLELTTFCWRR